MIPYSDKSDFGQSHLGVLWEEALIKYNEECGTDLRALPATCLTTAHIKAEQANQLLAFNKYRHDHGKLDKLRTLVVQNTYMVTNVATHLAEATSAAFPPSAAILTAFNYVMNASRAVSDDYDMIVSFFDVINTFLERISMLEGRMPDEWQFRRFLVNVFSSIMVLSAIARKCRLKGRLNRWAKALIDGSDPKLKGAFDSLHVHLERFESAATLTTLKHTLASSQELGELKVDSKKIGDGVAEIKTGLKETHVLGLATKGYAMKAALTSHDILTAITKNEERHSEFATEMYQVMKSLDRKPSQKDPQGQLVNPGSPKSIAMRTLETLLDYKLDDGTDFNAFERHYVDGTCGWYKTHDAYHQFEAGEARLLWLQGAAGMGKSTLAWTIFKALENDFLGYSNTDITYFSFCGSKKYQSASHMLRSCALQVALRNEGYRKESVADAGMYKTLSPGKTGINGLKDTWMLWKSLFQTKFTKKSGRHLILVIDELDEAVEDDRQHMERFLESVSTSDQLNIQVLLVGECRSLKSTLENRSSILSMTKELILPDIRAVIIARLSNSDNLRKLSKQCKRKIITKLSNRADTMRYVDHVLRSLELVGRSETAVLCQVNSLPSSTFELYQNILAECEKSHSDQELVSLRKLFAWLAYRSRPLTLDCARRLVNYIDTGNTINIDHEIDFGCSRILRLSSATIGQDHEEDFDDIDFTDDQSDHDDSTQNNAEVLADFLSIVGFQEKGLRGFFHPLRSQVSDRLRTSESSAHAIVLETVQFVLCNDDESENEHSLGQMALYAEAISDWTQHLQAINQAELSEEECTCVVKSVYSVLSNKGGSLRKMESLRPRWGTTGPPCVLGWTEESINSMLDCLQIWAIRAGTLPSSSLSDEATAWMRPLAHNPQSIFIELAKTHVTNWLAGSVHTNDWAINKPYLFAHYALYRGRHLPAIQQNASLGQCFMEHAGHEDMSSGMATELSLISVSRLLPQICMSPQSRLSVAVSLFYNDLLEPALEQLDLAIRLSPTDIEAMEIYMRMGQICILLAESADSNSRASKYATTKVPRGQSHIYVDSKDDMILGLATLKGHDRIESALEAIDKATKVISNLNESAMQDKKTRTVAHAVWMLKAKAEIKQGDTSNTVAFCKKAVAVYHSEKESVNTDILSLLAKTGDWSVFLDVVKVLSGTGWLTSITCLEQYMNEIHSAAKATDETEFVIEQYRYTLPMAEFNGANESRLMVNWALFYYHVVGTPEAISKAKDILNRVIESKGPAKYLPATFSLSDILLEEFRRTVQAEKKMAMYKEMQTLINQTSQSMGSDFDPSLSQISISLAHMARKLNAFEYYQGLQGTFERCIMVLKDEEGWNDAPSLKMIAKTLALVGLEREAQIAATCWVHIPDEETKKHGSLLSWDIGTITCNDCGKEVSHWVDGDVYLCYYCTDVNLCHACFTKRADEEAEELSDNWRVVCPREHRHIRMPVQGWKGFSDGVIKIEGEETNFHDWLIDIKEAKWVGAWDQFWTYE